MKKLSAALLSMALLATSVIQGGAMDSRFVEIETFESFYGETAFVNRDHIEGSIRPKDPKDSAYQKDESKNAGEEWNVALTRDYLGSGQAGLSFQYQFTGENASFLMKRPLDYQAISLEGMENLSFYLKGDGTNNQFTIQLITKDGTTFTQTVPMTTDGMVELPLGGMEKEGPGKDLRLSNLRIGAVGSDSGVHTFYVDSIKAYQTAYEPDREVYPATPTNFLKLNIKNLENNFMRDPYLYNGDDGYYYLIGTVKSFWQSDGIKLYRAKTLDGEWDLVTNEESKDGYLWYAKDKIMDKFKKYGGQDDKFACWAPEIHHVNGDFYITYTMPFYKGSILKSRTGKIEGPYDDLYPDSFPVPAIDGSIFQDTDGRVYLTYGSGTLQEMNADLTEKVGGEITLKNPNCGEMCFEGPSILHYNNKYYYYGAHYASKTSFPGGAGTAYSCMVSQSDSLFGDYSDRYIGLLYGGHNCIFEDKEGNLWATTFCLPGYSGRTCLVPMEVDANGRLGYKMDGFYQTDTLLNETFEDSTAQSPNRMGNALRIQQEGGEDTERTMVPMELEGNITPWNEKATILTAENIKPKALPESMADAPPAVKGQKCVNYPKAPNGAARDIIIDFDGKNVQKAEIWMYDPISGVKSNIWLTAVGKNGKVLKIGRSGDNYKNYQYLNIAPPTSGWWNCNMATSRKMEKGWHKYTFEINGAGQLGISVDGEMVAGVSQTMDSIAQLKIGSNWELVDDIWVGGLSYAEGSGAQAKEKVEEYNLEQAEGGLITTEFDIYPTTAAGMVPIGFGDDTIAFSGGAIVFNQGSKTYSLGSYEPNEWIHIAVEWDFITQKLNIRKNNDPVLFAFYADISGRTGLGSVSVYTGPGYGYYLDNLKVVKTAKTDETVPVAVTDASYQDGTVRFQLQNRKSALANPAVFVAVYQGEKLVSVSISHVELTPFGSASLERNVTVQEGQAAKVLLLDESFRPLAEAVELE